MPWRVLSSNVGPNPPVVIMYCGFRAIASQMLLAISLMLSWITVTRLTLAPRFVAFWVDSVHLYLLFYL